MINTQKWFTNNWKKSESFRLDYSELLNSSNLTNKNLEDFNNSNYKLTKLDIFKYITVLDYLFKNNEYVLAYLLNPYLIDKFNTTNKLLAYNEILEINQYKNIIIDLFFLDIPNTAYKSIPLNILLDEVENKKQITPYSEDLKELHKMGYGFGYFGKKSMSLFFPLYYKAFYKNITLYSYNDKYCTLAQVLINYSKDKLTESSESTRYSTFLTSKIKNYSSVITKWDDLDLKSFNIISKILKDILLDPSIKQLHFECNDFVSPLDIQEIDNSYIAEYCFLYNEQVNKNSPIVESVPSEDPSYVHEGIEMYLYEMTEYNINSAFLTPLILSYTSNIDD